MTSSSSRSSKPFNRSDNSAKKEQHTATQKSIGAKPPATKAAKNLPVANVADKNARNLEENSKITKSDYACSSIPVRMVVEAERRYNKCVNEARKRRKELLKQAAFEATDELRQLRKRFEDSYIEQLERFSLEEKAMAENIGAETERNLKEMRERFVENRSKTLKLISDAIEDIHPRPHRNLTLRQKIEKQFQ